MAVVIANTQSSNSIDNTSGTATLAATHAAGEGFLLWYFYEYDFSTSPSGISSVVWDPAGDNQAMTLVALVNPGGSGRRVALYHLKNPTSAKSGNIVVTHSGSTLTRAAYRLDRVTGFDTTTWISNSANRTETTPLTNNLPITCTSATGELVIAGGFVRVENAYVNTGDASNYVEIEIASSRSLFRGTKNGASSVSFTFGYTELSTNYDNGLIAVSIAASNTATFAGSPTLDDAAPTGSFSTAPLSSFSGTVTLDDAAPTGSFSRAPGTITSDPLKTNNGTLIASTALDFVCFYDDSTGALVLRKTGISTDASGVFTVTDALLQQGVTYRVDWQVSTGQRRMPRRAAT